MTTYPLTGSPTVLDGGTSTLIAVTNSGLVPVQVQASGPNGRIGRQILPGGSATVPGWRDARTTVQTAGQAGQVDVTLTAGSPAAGPGPGAVSFSPGAASSMAVTVTGGSWFSDEGLTTAVTWPKTVTTPTTYYPAAPASVRAAMTVGSTTQTRGLNVVDGCAESFRWESSGVADGHLTGQTSEAQTGASAGSLSFAGLAAGAIAKAGYKAAWYTSTPGSAGTATPVEGQVNYAPIWIPRACSIDRLVAEVTGGGTSGALLRLGLYDLTTDGMPGSLLVDAGTSDGTTIAVKELTIAQVLATPGLYWGASVVQGAAGTRPTVRCINGQTGVQISVSSNQGISFSYGGYTENSVAGALPATATPAAANGTITRMGIRFV